MTDQQPAFMLSIAYTGEWITMNKGTRGEHWAVLKKKQNTWAAFTLASWASQGRPRNQPACRLESMFVFRNNRRRDPHNFVPTLKPIIDQLVRCGVWPDDNPTYLQVPEPKMVVSRDSPPGVILRAYPLEPVT